MARTNLLVDLDGTITDPEEGILGSVQHALRGVGIEPPPRKTLHWVIGPPLRFAFPELGVPSKRLDDAIRIYRERYANGGMFEAALIDGIGEALRTLQGQGMRLYVATSKPHVYARPIIAHFGLADVFVGVHGAELDGRNDAKRDVIASILNTHNIAPETCIMIGDTAFDVEGARAHGIPTIGVSWGHGGERLAAAGPAVLIDRADELSGAVARLSI